MADLSVVSRAVWFVLAAMGEHSAKNTLRHSAVPVGRAPDVGSQPDGPFVTSFRNGRKVPHHAIWDDNASSKSKRFRAADSQVASGIELARCDGSRSAYPAG